MNRLIIGLGSGRCGTLSLAKLLEAQDRCVGLHEPSPLLPWVFDSRLAQRHLWRLRQQSRRVVASVACFYLPYVAWIEQQAAVPVRFVCLKRVRHQTVTSFMDWTETRVLPKRDHWRQHDGTTYEHTEWDKCFPNYNASSSKLEAIGTYYDEYYDRAESFQDSKDNFRIFPMNMLNDAEGVRQILTFCGFERPKVHVGLKAHHQPEKV